MPYDTSIIDLSDGYNCLPIFSYTLRTPTYNTYFCDGHENDV